MYRKNLAIVVLAMMCFAVTGLWAQSAEPGSGEATVFQNYPGALGAYGNIMTGGGLTYQRWFGKAGLEATLGAMVQTEGSFEYGVQAAFQYMLFGEDFANWFSGALYTNVLLAHTATGSTATGTTSYTPYGHLGLGVGIEMVFLRHLSTSVEFMYVGRIPLKVDFSVGGSLKYRF